MAHTHDVHHDVMVERDGGLATGFVLGIVALLVLMVLAVALLWTQPWDSGSGSNNPGITDNSGGGGGDGGGGGQQGGGTSDGGGQPAQ